MALEGTIADYGLGDVMQLLARGRRSGRLRLSGEHDTLEMHLASGHIAGIHSDRPASAELGSRMVRAGVLSESNLGWALAKRVETGRELGSILIEADLIDPDELELQTELHEWELLLAPFTWSKGRYAFENGPSEPSPEGALPLDLLLMRGVQLVDGWKEALRRVPSRSWVVARRLPLPPPVEPDPFGIEASTTSRPGQAPLSDEARELHPLAALGEGVGRVLDRARLDRYGATSALAELVDAGLVVLSPP